MRFRVPPGLLGEYYTEGLKFFTAREYEKAIEQFQKLLAEKPEYPDIWYYLALSYHYAYQPGKALEAIQKALKINPDYIDALQAEGRIQTSLFQFKKALASFQKALSLRPYFADLHVDIARAYFHEQEFKKAQDHLKKALEINPGYAHAYYLKGLIALRQEKMEEAHFCLERAIQLDPYDPLKKALFSALLFIKNEKKLASSLLAEARRDFPAAPFYQLLEKAFQKKRTPLSLPFLSRKLHPIQAFEKKEAYFLISLALAKAGFLEEAEFLFEEGLKVLPDHPEVPVYLAAIWEERGERKKACELLQKVIATDSNNAKAYFSLGLICFHEKKLEEALDCFQKATEKDPSFPESFFYLGEVYEQMNNLNKAREMWEKALELAPDHLPAQEKLKLFQWRD